MGVNASEKLRNNIMQKIGVAYEDAVEKEKEHIKKIIKEEVQ